MAVIQISKIQMRRGGELDLPGKPKTTSPLVFEPGLDIGEFGYAVDTGRLFLGHSPNFGNPNYKRIAFPYENLEVLTEASIDTLRRIFNFLRRDTGGTGYFKAILSPTPDGDWQDVRMQRGVGGAVPFRFPGDVVIANIEYFAMLEFDDTQNLINNCSTEPTQVGVVETVRTPIQQGSLRILSEDCNDEALLNDTSLAVRRTDLITPDAMDPNLAQNNITFRVVRGGGVGERYFRLQYQSPFEQPVTLWFDVQRPLSDGNNPFDFVPAGNPSSPSTGYTREDIEDIVGEMVQNNIETNINVTYDDCGGKLDFVAQQGGGGGGWNPFTLTLSGEANGGTVTLDGNNATLPMYLTPTGVIAGTYSYPTVTVDLKGRITTISNGTLPASTTTASNLGSGAGLFRQKIGNDLQFKTITAGANIILTSPSPNELMISSTGGGGGEPEPQIEYSAASVGTGGPIYKDTLTGSGQSIFRFKSLRAGPNVTLTQNADDIVISATGGGTGGPSTPLTVTGRNTIQEEWNSTVTPYANITEIAVTGYASVTEFDTGRVTIDVHSDNIHEGCTFVNNGSLAVDTPQDGRFAGIEVPLVNSDNIGTESAYWYYDPEYSAWTAFRDDRHPGSCVGEHPPIQRLTDVRGRFFIPERPGHAWSQRAGTQQVEAMHYVVMNSIDLEANIEEGRIITVSYAHADETNGVLNVGTTGFTSVGIIYINGIPVLHRDNTVLGGTTSENTMQYIDEESREGPINISFVVLSHFGQNVRPTGVRDSSMVVESILNRNRGTAGSLTPPWLPGPLEGPETPSEPPAGTQYWYGTTVLDLNIPSNGFAWGYQYWEWKGTGPAPEPPSPQGQLCTTSSPWGPPIYPLCFIGNSTDGYPRTV